MYNSPIRSISKLALVQRQPCIIAEQMHQRGPELNRDRVTARNRRLTLHVHRKRQIAADGAIEVGLATELFDLSLRDLEKLSLNAIKSAFAPFDKRLKIIFDTIKPGFAAARAGLG